MFSLTTHRDHQRIDALFFKVRVVNQGRLKTVSRMANVGDQLGIAIDVH